MTGPTLHSLDRDLAAHLAECSKENRHMWSELRSLKRWAATAAGGTFSLLVIVCGVLLKNHLHL